MRRLGVLKAETSKLYIDVVIELYFKNPLSWLTRLSTSYELSLIICSVREFLKNLTFITSNVAF